MVLWIRIKESILKVDKSNNKKIFLLSQLIKEAGYVKTLSYGSLIISNYFVLIDHKIRNNSTSEAFKVKKLLKKNQINLRILTNRIIISNNIQKKARDIRYELLINFCKKNKIKYILTAHHSDDQIETFLIMLSRGSGVQGL